MRSAGTSDAAGGALAAPALPGFGGIEEEPVPDETGDGGVPAPQLRLGEERFAQAQLDVGMQNDGTDPQDQWVEGRPLGIEIGAGIALPDEFVALGRADGQQPVEDDRPRVPPSASARPR